jgi:hypothetical protein
MKCYIQFFFMKIWNEIKHLRHTFLGKLDFYSYLYQGQITLNTIHVQICMFLTMPQLCEYNQMNLIFIVILIQFNIGLLYQLILLSHLLHVYNSSQPSYVGHLTQHVQRYKTQ